MNKRVKADGLREAVCSEGNTPKPAATVPPAAVKKKRGVLSWISVVAGLVVVVVASLGVAWGVRRYVMTSPRFSIRTVVVDGAVRHSAERVAELGQIVVGKNIFSLDLDLAQEAIVTDPWIAEARVVRQLPGAVHVQIVEHDPAAIVAIDQNLYLATRDGEIFKALEAEDPHDLPVITGIEPTKVVNDRDGAVMAVKRALDVAAELDRVTISARHPLQEIHLDKDGSLVATVGRDAIALHFGQPPYKGKVEQAKMVLDEVRARKADAAVIFLDNDANPQRVVVRMR